MKRILFPSLLLVLLALLFSLLTLAILLPLLTLAILLALQQGEKCACVLLEELSISQPTLSHHMKLLCDSGLVAARKEGKWMHYGISPAGAAAFRDMIGTYARCDCETHSPQACRCGSKTE